MKLHWDFSSAYCQSVLNADEAKFLSRFLANLRQDGVFGVEPCDLDKAIRLPFGPICVPIVAEICQQDADFEDSHYCHYKQSFAREVRRIWKNLPIESGIDRLEFLLEFYTPTNESKLPLYGELINALHRGEDIADIYVWELRFNPWFHQIVAKWAAKRQKLSAV